MHHGVTINRAREIFRCELYLRRRLKLFRNVSRSFSVVATLQLIRIRTTAIPDGRGVRERIKIYRSFRIAVS